MGDSKYLFEVKEEHLKLIQRMWIVWSDEYYEHGSPAVDPQRPYGNSDVEVDVAEIFGLPVEEIYSDLPDDENPVFAEARRLHRQTGIALQTCLATRSFVPGVYERDDANFESPYGWRLVEEKRSGKES